ncbi:hypothetical protein [Sandaracinobacteroides hominis]|uniref:hypothetical protein n=1 Tax=Sandaracinobacteroides hominis TaxID=2780086 RepID=UPI0018F419BC|nr:hypothetical protein [Sandaracinobacteroides hominis]
MKPEVKPADSPIARLFGFGLTRMQATGMGLLFAFFCFVPIALLADKSADVAVPFTRDYAMLARVLVALPLVVAFSPHLQGLIDEALDHAPKSNIVTGADTTTYERWVHLVRQLRASRIAELLFVAMAFASGFTNQQIPGVLAGLHGWGYSAAGELNLAGQWYVHVVLPLFRLMVLIWIWRLLMWTLFLGSLSFLKLNLNPAHPDGAADLGYLGFVQQRLSIALAIGSLMLAGSAANRIAYLGEHLGDHLFPLLGFILLYPALLLAPLILTCPLLLRTKRNGVFEYSLIGDGMAAQFRRDWIDNPGDAGDRLASPNPSAMADFTMMHSVVQEMSILPIRSWAVISMFVAAAGPLLLLVLLEVPLDALLRSALSELPPLDLVATYSQPFPQAPPGTG